MRVDWLAVEELRRRSFHGATLTDKELAILHQAMKEDLERYSRIGVELRSEYAASFRGGER